MWIYVYLYLCIFIDYIYIYVYKSVFSVTFFQIHLLWAQTIERATQATTWSEERKHVKQCPWTVEKVLMGCFQYFQDCFWSWHEAIQSTEQGQAT